MLIRSLKEILKDPCPRRRVGSSIQRLHAGCAGDRRILAPRTVSLMHSDHLPPSIDRRTTIPRAFGPLALSQEFGISFGLGFALRIESGRNPLLAKLEITSGWDAVARCFG